MSLIFQSINNVINSHMLKANPLKLYQHNPPCQALPVISEVVDNKAKGRTKRQNFALLPTK